VAAVALMAKKMRQNQFSHKNRKTMIITKIKRTLKSGFVSFWRNGYVSLASVLVMTVTLLVISSMFLFGAMLKSTLTTIQNKVDISLYFKTDAQEADIMVFKKRLEDLSQVAGVTYVSRDDALAEFRERHKDDGSTLAALDEIGGNPLGASFNIKAKSPAQYQGIVSYITNVQDSSGDANGAGDIIDRVNYANNKQAIDALTNIIDSSNTLGFALIIFFAFVAILITFNTVRLAIYVFREEISVMRLVGASEMYIRGPFVTVGLMYGLASAILAILILFPVAYYVGPITVSLGTGINIWDFYMANFFAVFGIVVGAGALLGFVSSYLAVRKYLKV
jgi:cell division transport system permease protein